MLTSDTCE
ncbi:unnamed protein product, partial [Rotaria sp. Silwood1]